jgi:hypothetical protein
MDALVDFLVLQGETILEFGAQRNTHVDILRYVDIVVFEPPITTLPR